MILSVEITAVEAERLGRRAARTGQDLSSFVRTVLQRESLSEGAKSDSPAANDDLWDEFLGVVDSSQNGSVVPSHQAENTGEAFATLIQEKHRAGKL